MYIISQDKKHLLNMEHIISVDVNQPLPDGSVKITATSAHEFSDGSEWVLGTFKSERDAENVLEFIAFCKAKGTDKITAIPSEKEMDFDVADALSKIFGEKKEGKEPSKNPIDDLIERALKGGAVIWL